MNAPARRLPQEPRCDRFLFCGLPGGHAGDECAVLPQAGFQEQMARCAADGALGGGAVGAGKSAILLIEPLRHIDVPGFTALILRKEQRDFEKADGLWQKSLQLYPAFGGESKVSEYLWTFPSGATIQFGYVDNKTYERDHQGSRACFMGFDEFTHFTRRQVLYMLLRNGTACRVRPYWRATCNPERESWVRNLVDWYVGPDGWPLKERAGKLRYYVTTDAGFAWGNSIEEVCAAEGVEPEDVQSFTFLPGSLEENLFQDKQYRGKIRMQSSEERLRWRGNWNAGDAKGKAFDPLWFRTKAGELRQDLLVDHLPAGAQLLRSWDLAATAEEDAGSNTSFSAGPLLALHDGILYFADLEVGRWGAAGVEERVKGTAAADGREVPIWICAERAGAGKRDMARWTRLLVGYEVNGEPETGDKGVRLLPLIALAERGLVRLVRDAPERRWNETLVQHLLYLTKDGKGRPNDVGDAAAAGLERLAEQAERGGVPSVKQVQAIITATAIVPAPATSPRQGRGAGAGVGPGRFRLAPAWGAPKPPGRGR